MTGTPLLVALVVATGSVVRVSAGRAVTEADRSVRMHVVKPGETLWSIAREDLGSAAEWSSIYRLNRTVVGPDPADLKPGTALLLVPRQPVGPAPRALPAASFAPSMHASVRPASSPGSAGRLVGPRNPFEFGGAPVRSGPRPIPKPGRNPFTFGS